MLTGQNYSGKGQNQALSPKFEQTAGQFTAPKSPVRLDKMYSRTLDFFERTEITKGDHLIDEDRMLEDMLYLCRRYDESLEFNVDWVLYHVFEYYLAALESYQDPEVSEAIFRTYRLLTQFTAIGIYSRRIGGDSQYERQRNEERKAARKSRKKAN